MVRFAEFFAGIGLVREAVAPLGWECVFANDIAPGKAEMYRERFGAGDLVVDDINNLSVQDLPEDLDAVTASFPCTDLSLAGNRAGLAGKHSGTVWPLLDLLAEQCRRREAPSGLLLENVTGFLSSRGGRDLFEVCRRIAELGYAVDLAVVDARLVHAAEPAPAVRDGGAAGRRAGMADPGAGRVAGAACRSAAFFRRRMRSSRS